MIIDINNLEKLSYGQTSDVFILDDTKVVKVFFDSIEQHIIENEYRVNKLIQSYGICVPTAYEMVDCGNRKGIVFQRVKNNTLNDEIARNQKRYLDYAKILANEHAKINAISDRQHDLPDQKEAYANFIDSRISIDEKCKQTLIAQLMSLPCDDKVCHGDFHPGNLLFDNDKIFIIDWMGATRGNPLLDVAGSCLIIKLMATELTKMSFIKKKITSIFIKRFVDVYIKEYIKNSNLSMSEINKWIPVKAVTYLDVGLPKNVNDRLLELIHTPTK